MARHEGCPAPYDMAERDEAMTLASTTPTQRSSAGSNPATGLRRAGDPALRLRLNHQPYDSVLLGLADAQSRAQELQARVG